jgi:hypothetical protein
MSRTKKLLIGFATFWPMCALVLFYAGIFCMIFLVAGNHGRAPGESLFGPGVIFFLVNVVWVISLLVGYIGHVYRNEQIEPEAKLVWALVIFFGSLFAMPVYWYIYIWRDPV